jgi:hypothetical protein
MKKNYIVPEIVAVHIIAPRLLLTGSIVSEEKLASDVDGLSREFDYDDEWED